MVRNRILWQPVAEYLGCARHERKPSELPSSAVGSEKVWKVSRCRQALVLIDRLVLTNGLKQGGPISSMDRFCYTEESSS